MTSTRPPFASALVLAVRFWIVVALVLVAVAACAFDFSGHVADVGADQAPLIGP
jgi:hypothetical protein